MLFSSQESFQIDLSVKDVMVGTVRNHTQLEFIMKYNGYYVPAIFVNEDPFAIRYIALYEIGTNGSPCIKRYGEVVYVRKVNRSRIPVPTKRNNGNEPYYYFQVRCWDEIPHTIEICDTQRGQPLFTNKFLLDNCTHSYELFSITSGADYRLMSVINKAFEDMHDYEPEGYCNSYRINESCSLIMAQGYIAVVNGNGELLEKIPYNSFTAYPKDGFDRIKRAVYI